MRSQRHLLNKILIILLILQLFYTVYLVSIEFDNQYENSSLKSPWSIDVEGKNKDFESDIVNNNLKIANYWNLTGTPIYIDDTDVGTYDWATINATYDWCNGSGTQVDPYIIENVTIDGQNSGNCIEIRYSNVYFIIRNCTLYNGNSIGIYLYQVRNGKIFNNTCSSCDYGIQLFFGDYINITDNILMDNAYTGIQLESFNDNNIISNNIAINNNQHGIRVSGDSDFNTITENIVERHIYSGIILQGGSNNNIVSRNTVVNNNPLRGIWVYNSDFNTIEDNLVSNTGRSGILIEESNYNNILDNTITANNGDAIRFSSWSADLCEYNLIKMNKIYNNLGSPVYIDTYSRNNEIYFNAFVDNNYRPWDYGANKWDNGTIGNYWSDYSGVDADDDGIGDTPYFIAGLSGSQDNFPIWDNKPPKSNIFFIPYNNTYIVAKSTYFTLFADDGIGSGVSVIKYKINDSVWSNYTAPFTLSKYQYGDTLISFHAIDNKGNIETINTILVNLIKLPSNPIVDSFDIVILSCIFCLISMITIKKHVKNRTFSRR